MQTSSLKRMSAIIKDFLHYAIVDVCGTRYTIWIYSGGDSASAYCGETEDIAWGQDAEEALQLLIAQLESRSQQYAQ